mgnify:CR=1 FL=1
MKKWIGFFLSLLLFLIGASVGLKFSIPDLNDITDPTSLKQAISEEDQGSPRRAVFGTEEERRKKGEGESYYIQTLRAVREKLNEWLKSLNDRIESEDITRLEVRFLEILRNILEWLKEKMDAKLGTQGEQKTETRYRRLSSLRVTIS